ncbi:Primosomal protein N' [Pseudoalteromonas holothuriae]|uniref:Replication restart protein PriA n=1 Tax=Pseudoalteromonas holothuriae TaxID=2963714 RepID=A0A9W4QVH1_9GAMM|nr:MULTISPECIES: primosomal protein N' [unclassified Pseudoalteromonas]CAH9055487.1 Primosomal protein N' [Pseudoalteromonas sp. CIP111854]CAH9062980.1 Primosomal protein N' [Pseudoalteromonas sp. CIP111951]
MFAEVAIKVPLFRTFDYRIADNCTVQVGCRVTVPFGNRKLVAIVMAIKSTSEVPANKLKSLTEVLDDSPILSTIHLKFLRFCAQYYAHPIGETLFTALPAALRDGAHPDKTTIANYVLSEAGKLQPKLRAKKQMALLAQLGKSGESSLTELKALGFSKQQINALLDKQLITEQIKHDTQWQNQAITIANKPRLNEEQATACSAINQQHNYRCFLLEGITGSGKTEVYLQSLERIVQSGKQALILVPEIGLTPQTVNRFRRRFANLAIDLWHSNLTDNERLHTWRRAEQGSCALVIGTRSSVFLPFKSLGMIIVDEEHDGSFKQQEGLRYHARDLAAYRCASINIPLILGTATPALETLNKAITGKYQLLTLSQRAQTTTDNQFLLVDMKGQKEQAGLAPTTLQHIAATLKRTKQVMVFLNRRGYAPTLLCHECGWLSQCKHCSASTTYHKAMGRLVCHHCSEQSFVPPQCPDCGSTQIMPTGIGTEQLEGFLTECFAETPISRIDRDTTRRKGALEDALDEINQGGARILIGTQMLAKGHHFADVSLVVILDVDSGLYSSDFRATEHMAQLITQVAGRAGRSGEAGKVLLQTHFPEHPLLQDLVNNGYQDFARFALKEREEALLPPYSHLAILRAQATNAKQVFDFLSDLVPATPYCGIQLLGPIPAPMERLAGKYRYQLHIQASERMILHNYIRQLMQYVSEHKLANRVRWSIDIDPMDTY